MTDCAFYVNDWPMLEYSVFGTLPERSGNHDPNVAPYGEFAAKDGYVVFAVTSEKTWQKFCSLLGLDHLAKDPRFADNAKRVQNRAALIEEIEKKTKTMGRFEMEKLLASNNVPTGAVMSVPEVMLAMHTQDTGMLQVMDQEGIGKLFTTGIPMHFSKTPGAIRRGAPMLGQHSKEILKEAGFAEDAIGRLIAEKVVEIYEGRNPQ